MRRGAHLLHVASLVAGVSLGARDSSMILVGADGFHPSVLGTYAAALTVACTLLPKDRPSLAAAARR
jgi:hypothetical protein